MRDLIAWALPGPPADSAAARKARRRLLDSLGCALAGLRHPRVAGFACAMEGGFPGDVALAGARLAPGAAAAVLSTATCCDEANEGLAAAMALRDRVPPAPQRIILSTYAEALRYAGNRAPRAAISAQFSLSWAVAAALAQGDLGPAAYTDAALADPRALLHDAPAEGLFG